jgi:hypothetical protein
MRNKGVTFISPLNTRNWIRTQTGDFVNDQKDPDVPANDKELNFARLREENEKLQRQLQALRTQQPHSEVAQEIGIGDDEPWIETRHLPRLLGSVEERMSKKIDEIVDSKLRDYKQSRIFTDMQAETKGRFADAVTEEKIKGIIEREPHMADVFDVLAKVDPLTYAKVVYQKSIRDEAEAERIADLQRRADEASFKHRAAPLPVALGGKSDNNFVVLSSDNRGDRSAYEYAQKLINGISNF